MMKTFWRYIFPPIFGLLIYFTIRLINDSIFGSVYLSRPLAINSIEICMMVIYGYVFYYITNYLEKKLLKKSRIDLSLQTVLKDFLYIYLGSFIAINALLTPFVALTDDGLSVYDFVQINTIPILYILLYFAIKRGNFYLTNYVENKLKAERIENQQLQTELNYLRSQMHPHFLFNSLNTVYFEMEESIEGAKKTIEQFSELLRYQLYETNKGLVPLDSELSQLTNYIQLQQKRYSEKLQLKVDLPQNTPNYFIHPLLMLPLVENAFKYVGGEYQMEIGGKIEEGQFYFTILNSKLLNPPKRQEKAGRIGLPNLQRRLELIYPHQHQLEIVDEYQNFKVSLTVPLSNHA